MCVAIIVPKDAKAPDKETLEACEAQNPDGGGVAWLDKGKVCWKKGIDTAEILKILAKTQAPYLIHYRISTVGGKVASLCHPFPITKNASLDLEGRAGAVLIHNGHWSSWKDKTMLLQPNGQRIPEGVWSDTRAMAYLSAIYGADILTFVDEKVAVLNATGSIEYWGHWQKEGDCMYSNTSWKFTRSKKTKTDTDPYSSYMHRNWQHHGWQDDSEINKRKSEQNVLNFGHADKLTSDFVRENTDPSIAVKLLAAAEIGKVTNQTPTQIQKSLNDIVDAHSRPLINPSGDMLVTGGKVDV